MAAQATLGAQDQVFRVIEMVFIDQLGVRHVGFGVRTEPSGRWAMAILAAHTFADVELAADLGGGRREGVAEEAFLRMLRVELKDARHVLAGGGVGQDSISAGVEVGGDPSAVFVLQHLGGGVRGDAAVAGGSAAGARAEVLAGRLARGRRSPGRGGGEEGENHDGSEKAQCPPAHAANS